MKIRDNSESGHFRLDSVLIREGWGSVLGSYGVAAYTVLACLADNETQECWPSYQYIADAADMSREQAILMVARLVRYGLVHKKRRGKKGLFTSNVYTLLHPSVWKPPRGSKPDTLRRGQGKPGSGGQDTPKLTPPSLTKPQRTNRQTSKYKWMSEEEFEEGWYDDDDKS